MERRRDAGKLSGEGLLWELLAIELQGLIDLDFDVEITGFAPVELDFVLEEEVRSVRVPRCQRPYR